MSTTYNAGEEVTDDTVRKSEKGADPNSICHNGRESIP